MCMVQPNLLENSDWADPFPPNYRFYPVLALIRMEVRAGEKAIPSAKPISLDENPGSFACPVPDF
jgi:hypothetical protein